ncbi:hypothetical protein JHK82_034099 [Glycine max]|nr:hypothetical protein JHK87_034029 [Glycine soja]KAG4980851.1 hypothetical protein JHK85_034809 [Glycine max]KAG4986478.1 hypothetical protein JHK86_034169 [Glycine max]KAG5119679.1 hypothetical protein JHK82_034099 [Glycine max]KAG5140669.1 hypothetical protein JHK84_034437 [Glycine max]
MLLSNSSPPFSFVSGITMSTTTGITPRDSLLLKPNPLSSISSLHCLQHGNNTIRVPVTIRIQPERFCHGALTIGNEVPQNADFPRQYSRKEKKPFPVPIVELRRAGRMSAPKNGLLVKSLIPTAYNVYNATRITLINNLKKLLKVVPVHACGWCSEIHLGSVGHSFKSSYHLFDRLGKRITHEERFSIPRIPAVVELRIQASVEIPEFPTKRRRKPIIRIWRKEFIDADESNLPDKISEGPLKPLLAEIQRVRKGAKRLMRMYNVRVCGYCPEIHVGAQGLKAKNCEAHKHQQRNGQHGWQSAVLDDLIPPRFVWHVPDVNALLERELRNSYGQAHVEVEMCIQAGAALPEQYKSTMRLDVGIPSTLKEADMVV